MLKIVIKVKSNEATGKCQVELIAPKNYKDVDKNEQIATVNVLNQITKALEEIQD